MSKRLELGQIVPKARAYTLKGIGGFIPDGAGGRALASRWRRGEYVVTFLYSKQAIQELTKAVRARKKSIIFATKKLVKDPVKLKRELNYIRKI